jgi:hypothetical protein
MTSHSSCVGMICDRPGVGEDRWAAGAALPPEVELPVRARFAARVRVLVVIVQKPRYASVLARVTPASFSDLSRRASDGKDTVQPWEGLECERHQNAEATHPAKHSQRVAALKLGRTPASVYQKASAEGISLKPTNQRPYGSGSD